MALYKQVAMTDTPSSGGTVNIPAFDSAVMAVFIDPPGLLAVLNVTLPLGCQHGQALRIFFSKTITILTITAPGSSIIGSITTIAAGASVVYAYNQTNNEWWKG